MGARQVWKLAAPMGFAVVAAPLGFAVAQAASGGQSIEAVVAVSPTVPTNPQPDVHLEPNEVTPAEVDVEALAKSAVPLSECPEALEFLTSPDVVAFTERYFGQPLSPDQKLLGGCPDVDELKAAYAEAQQRVAGGKQ
ncbi:hypothetical protein [Nocardioides sp.]|uniref:hypothetical protein n=1 Tax=Nocardioides sp. TaxID=35761 RepID=UPI0039E281F4